MKLAVAVLSVLALTGHAALATNTPYQVYHQGYEPGREQARLHEMGKGKSIALNSLIHGSVYIQVVL